MRLVVLRVIALGGLALALASGASCGRSPLGDDGGPGAEGSWPPPPDRGVVDWPRVPSPLPDLVVTDLKGSFAAGGDGYYGTTVCNQGGQGAGATQLELFYASSLKPTSAAAADRTIALPALKAGACSTLMTTATLKPGTNLSWAWVDRKNLVAEGNEGNNVLGPVPITVGKPGPLPDLTITKLTAVTAAGSGFVTYEATVCNSGTAAVPSATLELFYNPGGPPTATQPADKLENVVGLGVGQCKALVLYATLAAGKYASYAVVDRKNAVVESDEANNVTGPVAVITPGVQQLPDLVVAKLAAAVAGTQVTWAIDVCNKGAGASSSCYLSLYYTLVAPPSPSTKADGSIFLGPLAAGACSAHSWSVKLAGGSYQSWATVDPTNLVAEANEANNTAGPTAVVVGTPPTPCQFVCGMLFTPCGLLPQAQVDTCVLTCGALPQSKVDCAGKAAQPQPAPLCNDILSCLFG